MKRKWLVIGIILLLLTTWLSGCQSQGISIHKLNGGHQSSVNMTEEQMNDFPHIKEAILTNKSVYTPQEEMNRLRGILDFFNTGIILYQNEYYEVGFWY
jgi:hypothetical protein